MTLVLGILFTGGVVANTDAGLHVVSSPQIAGQLNATAATADNDIWAVGFSDLTAQRFVTGRLRISVRADF
ncbi:MAG TPA: hypothetical protein VNY07_07715 [Chthoniobacterales bacterium]|jgi:hypothetical protein|nr:hypothetical protein [Chthoniobacterales bacterium]